MKYMSMLNFTFFECVCVCAFCMYVGGWGEVGGGGDFVVCELNA